uniref:glucuronosyltransferase n=1 Tax=Meloidogyne javanica TaxID=6303 RepID=A0A915ME98_MELJA
MPVEVPELYTAQPGDGLANSEIRNEGSRRQNENIREIKHLITTYQQIFGNAYSNQNIPPLWQIIANVRYLLVNHPQNAAYPRPINDKIRFIGGVAIDTHRFLDFYSKVMTDHVIEPVWDVEDDEYSFLNNSECVVLVNFGPTSTFHGINQTQLESIFNAFREHQNCNFIFRADSTIELYANHYLQVPNNVHLFYDNIDIKGILGTQRNTKLAIMNCEQDSLNEVNIWSNFIFAGVPVICIPFLSDQHYNASVVEYLRVGMWVPAPNLENQFQTAVNALLNRACTQSSIFIKSGEGGVKKLASLSYGYLERAQQFARQLRNEQTQPIQKFLNAVGNAISSEVQFDHSIQLREIEFVDHDRGRLSEGSISRRRHSEGSTSRGRHGEESTSRGRHGEESTSRGRHSEGHSEGSTSRGRHGEESTSRGRHSEGSTSEGKILYLADSRDYSHMHLSARLANILDSNGYCVYFVIAIDVDQDYNQLNQFHLNDGLKKLYIQVANLPQFENVDLWEKEFTNSKVPEFTNVVQYQAVYFYQAIIHETNKSVLKRLEKTYFALGIADIGHNPSGFAIFYKLGITNTIATSATPASSPFYHFLWLAIPVEVPELYTARPGDGLANSEIRNDGSQRQNENMREIKHLIHIYCQRYGDSFFQQNRLPLLWQIIANVRYLLINHSKIVAYPRPINDKIGFIGGIAIEQDKLRMFYSKAMTDQSIQPDWDGEYEFLNDVCINAHRYTKLAIIDCGQDSLNEALYAGVPVICIPFMGEQRYNASVVEYLGLGIWVPAPNLENQFQTAVNALLNQAYGFYGRAQNFARQLNSQQPTPIQIFLNRVRNAIDSEVPFDHSIQLGDIQFVNQE